MPVQVVRAGPTHFGTSTINFLVGGSPYSVSINVTM